MSEQDQEYVIIPAAANEMNRYAKMGYKLAGVLPGYADHSDAVIMQRQADRSGAHAELHDALDGDITSLGKRIDMTEQQLRQAHIARQQAQEKIDQLLIRQVEELQRARESHRRSLDALCGRVEALEAGLQQKYNLVHNELVLVKQLVFAVEKRAIDLTETVEALEATTKNLEAQAHGHADRDLIERMHKRMDYLEIHAHAHADNASITDQQMERIDKALNRLEAEIVAVRRKAGYEDGESIREEESKE